MKKNSYYICSYDALILKTKC